MSHSHAEHDVREASGEAAGYEHKDANIRAIVFFGIGLTVFVILVMIGLLGVYRRFVSDRPAPESPQAKKQMGQQMLIHQREQLEELREQEDKELKKIDRAIDLVAERGVPAGKGPKTDIEINSHAGMPAPGPSDSMPSDSKKSESKP
ncbi:MAG TPA: hypothetical protein VKP69_24705 [Isosphaeraceae bacterium]|nr:hypothetical protein [Isosphaeraceae bacterium]